MRHGFYKPLSITVLCSVNFFKEESIMYLEVTDLCKSYGEGGSYTQVLKNVSL